MDASDEWAKSADRLEVDALQDLVSKVEDTGSHSNGSEPEQNQSLFTPEFVSQLSQEIRTPLNGVVAVADILLNTALTEEQREYAYTIRASGLALQEIIDDMLLLARAESGKWQSQITDCDVVSLVEGTIRLVAEKAELKRLLLITYVSPAVPAVVKADALRLRQILLHMLRNSLKFTDTGDITVEVSVQGSGNKFLRFAVRDTGAGISAQQMHRLFLPFQSIKPGSETGLGLTVSKRMVELMDGDIGCFSEEGKSSEFWFTIPLLPSSQVQERIALSSALRNKSWLVISGITRLHKLLSEYGKAWNMQIEVVSNGEEAIRALKKRVAEGHPYDYLSCEFVFGDEPVFTVIQVASSQGLLTHTKAILLSSHNEHGLGIRAIKSGYNAYLVSPVTQSEALECLTNVFNHEPYSLTLSSQKERAMPNDREESQAAADGTDTTYGDDQTLTKLLVVEDSPLNQRIISLLLTRLGYEADFESDGLHAVDRAVQNNYRLIFMDCRMPGIDGYKATQMIRSKEALTGRHVPIVAMTAMTEEGDREKCIESGMDDYLAKPIEFAKLEEILAKWARSKAS